MAENEETSSASFLLDNTQYAILSRIVKFSNPSDLFALSQVSREFNKLILIPGAINTIRCHYFLLESDKFYEQIVAPRGKFITKLIADNTITDGQVRRLLALCPHLLKFEHREIAMFNKPYFRPLSATGNEILSALADYCKQVEDVKLVYRWDSDKPGWQKFTNECHLLTNFSSRFGPVIIDNDILQVITDNKWPRLAKVYCDSNEIDVDTLSSLPITHLMVSRSERWTQLENLLNQLPQLQHFRVERFQYVDFIMKHLSTACTQLTSVIVGFEFTESLETLVNGCPLIEYAVLKADESTVDESILHTIGQGWKNLKDLTLKALFEIETKNIFSSFGQCSQLYSLNFGLRSTDAILADNIRCLPTHLKHFRLSCNSAEDLTAQAISEHLVNSTLVVFGWNSFAFSAAGHLFNMKHLTHLSIFVANFIKEEEFAKLPQSSCASTLQSLELGDCFNLSDECFSGFTKLRKLKKLVVAGTLKVSDDAIQALAQCDEFCKRLQYLVIIVRGRFGFTKAVFKSLAKFSDLRTCRLAKLIKITEADVQDFFNITRSPYLINVEFIRYPTGLEYMSKELIESKLNEMRAVVDNYYNTEFSN